MKRKLSGVCPFLALGVLLAYPAAASVDKLMDWNYMMYDRLIYALICFGMVCATLVFSEERSAAERLAALLVFHAACVCGCVLHLGLSMYANTVWVTGIVIAFVIASIAHFLKTKMTWKIKVPLGILTLVPLLSLMLFSLFGFIQFSRTTVVSSASPDGTRMAVLYVYDEGALGGSSAVRTYPTATVKRGLLGEWRQENGVYYGPWIDDEDLTFSWADNETLLLNGEPIPIS